MFDLFFEKFEVLSGYNNFHLASWKKCVGVMKLLHKVGIDIEAKGNDGDTAFYRACCFGHVDMMNLLIEMGVDVSADENRWSGFHEACQSVGDGPREA